MMAVKATQEQKSRQPGAATQAGRVTKRNQLRVEGVQEFNPSGNAPVRLSRQSEKQANANKTDPNKKSGCCGSSK